MTFNQRTPQDDSDGYMSPPNSTDSSDGLAVNTPWSWIQIGIMMGIVLLVCALSFMSFCIYRNRVYSKYGQVLGRTSSTRRLRRTWTHAKMHSPRKFGGLLRDIQQVKPEDRMSGWTIDDDDSETGMGELDADVHPYMLPLRFAYEQPPQPLLHVNPNKLSLEPQIPVPVQVVTTNPFKLVNLQQASSSSAPANTNSSTNPFVTFNIPQVPAAHPNSNNPFRSIVQALTHVPIPGRRPPLAYVSPMDPQSGFDIDGSTSGSSPRRAGTSQGRNQAGHLSRSLSGNTLVDNLNMANRASASIPAVPDIPAVHLHASNIGRGGNRPPRRDQALASPSRRNVFHDADGQSVIMISRHSGINQRGTGSDTEPESDLPPYASRVQSFASNPRSSRSRSHYVTTPLSEPTTPVANCRPGRGSASPSLSRNQMRDTQLPQSPVVRPPSRIEEGYDEVSTPLLRAPPQAQAQAASDLDQNQPKSVHHCRKLQKKRRPLPNPPPQLTITPVSNTYSASRRAPGPSSVPVQHPFYERIPSSSGYVF